jgi:hypothetical protein
MGVDIQTYRGRIGCFSRNFGTDVIIVQFTVNCTRGIKTIGAVVFIGILLLLAGIEQNPGPISGKYSRRKNLLRSCYVHNSSAQVLMSFSWNIYFILKNRIMNSVEISSSSHKT